MKFTSYLLFFITDFITTNSEKIIKNIDIKSCINCIYYKPSIYNDLTSPLSKCEKFGNKDIITDKITYDYVDLCRKDETKCGINGKYFEEDKNLPIKKFKHTVVSNVPLYMLMIIIMYLYKYF